MLAEPLGFGAAAGGFETVEKENWSRSQESYGGHIVSLFKKWQAR
jgi:hypothetical protein